ncbi:hypothetical protein [Psychroflexus lacisalsi]|jgi:hypothetical protein|uniref:Uncharacterized protein n=1 Tax=Psychroflexus lacisalsi TaxID=503928 RepID=A0ABN1K0W4_9FLAO|nr:hypothetical protein [Psychroflexus lacisalsi]MBZ9620727.1 hypothetical protein [Psychroflexus lacisalsi]
MKLLKNSFLGTVFLVAISSAISAATANDAEELRPDCHDTYNFCDYFFPSDFGEFDSCMTKQGCGA